MSVRDPFDAFLDDARAGVRRIADASPMHDFADVLDRAGLGAPDLTDADDPVVHLERGDAPEEAALDGWIADARSGLHARIDEHRMRPVPALRLAAPRSSRRLATWIAAGLAAAAVLAAVGLRADVLSRDTSEGVEQALHVETQHDATTGEAELVTPPRRERTTSRGPAVVPRQEPDASTPSSEPASRAERPHRNEPLAGLAAQAEARWKAGDLAGARKLYERIIARGGRTRHAELAFADLFSLTHQQGDGSGRRKLWRDYVRRFPEGRFADDARAGLCRSAPAETRAGCWQAYLARGGGAYRAEAEREAGASEP